MSRVIRFDLGIDEPARARAFYSSVFEWRIENVEGVPDYWVVTTGDSGAPGIDGALVQRRYPTQSTMCWIATPSLDEAMQKIAEHGGKNVTPRTNVPGYGDYAIAQDTEGNVFGVIQLREPGT